MSRAVTLWRRVYGAGPLHLAGHLIAFGIALFALHRIVAAGHAVDFLAWFLAAAVAHDLLLLPLYSLLDRGAARAVRRHRWRLEGSVINHLRAPAFISGVLLLVYAPEILGLGDTTYLNATGHHLHGYVRNWLLITVALFATSAIVYAGRAIRGGRAGRDGRS